MAACQRTCKARCCPSHAQSGAACPSLNTNRHRQQCQCQQVSPLTAVLFIACCRPSLCKQHLCMHVCMLFFATQICKQKMALAHGMAALTFALTTSVPASCMRAISACARDASKLTWGLACTHGQQATRQPQTRQHRAQGGTATLAAPLSLRGQNVYWYRAYVAFSKPPRVPQLPL